MFMLLVCWFEYFHKLGGRDLYCNGCYAAKFQNLLSGEGWDLKGEQDIFIGTLVGRGGHNSQFHCLPGIQTSMYTSTVIENALNKISWIYELLMALI